jgi:hypothetical protein
VEQSGTDVSALFENGKHRSRTDHSAAGTGAYQVAVNRAGLFFVWLKFFFFFFFFFFFEKTFRREEEGLGLVEEVAEGGHVEAMRLALQMNAKRDRHAEAILWGEVREFSFSFCFVLSWC